MDGLWRSNGAYLWDNLKPQQQRAIELLDWLGWFCIDIQPFSWGANNSLEQIHWVNLGSILNANSVPLSMYVITWSLITGVHIILLVRPLPHWILQMGNFLIISSHPESCFRSFSVGYTTSSCIFCALFWSYTADRIVNLLVGFLFLLISIPWEHFRKNNYFFLAPPWETITLSLYDSKTEAETGTAEVPTHLTKII